MIKFICDRCKKEFTPAQIFLEGNLFSQQPAIALGKDKEKVIETRQARQLIHLCDKCVEEFKKWLEGK